MKKTKVEDIKAEERDFLGKELTHKPFKNNFCGYENMKAKMLTATPYHDWVVGATYATFATWDCSCCKPLDQMDWNEMNERLVHMLSKRPISVAVESAKFTIYLSGISRAITHQLVRHRRMAFGQQSLRVSDPGHDPIRLPPAFEEDGNEDLMLDTISVLEQLKPLYYKLIEGGIPPEQARAVLPIGITTKITMTLDLREIIAYFKARTSSIAQDEHSFMVELIMKEFQETQPEYWKIVKKAIGR